MTDHSVNPNSELVSSITSSLLNQAQVGRDEAWNRLIHIYTPLVYMWCRQRGIAEVDSADIGQEVFVSAAKKIREFRRDREGHTFLGWLRTITNNKIADYFRRQGREVPVAATYDEALLEDNQSGSDLMLNSKEALLLFERAVEFIRSEFSETNWQIFQRIIVNEERPADIAADLQVSINQVYLAKSRILHRAREALIG